MEMIKNTVSWFEIPVTDFERAKQFYSTIYEYEMSEQVILNDRMGFLPFDAESGGIGGAIVKAEGYQPGKDGVRLYLNGGDDLSIFLDRVEGAGGKVILPKTEISPEHGYFAIFEDTEGNHISFHSPK